MGTITRDSLLTLEAYNKIRKSSRAETIAHRRLRSVQLGEHVTLQFEDEKTIRRQIQEMLKLAGQSVKLELNTVERCSGHAGTYGVKAATHPVAMKIGKPVFKSMAKDEPDVISSDCALAGHHIAQGMAQAGTPAKALQHPLSLVRMAYGLA